MKKLELRLMTIFRAGVVASLLLLGLVTAGPVTAQGTTVAPVSAQVDDDDDDDGFDWGLLGLLGLAGLAGLLKRPEREVRTTDRGADTRR